MFTEPDDLPGGALAGALQDLWGFTAVSLEYQPVGFGSHHWLATDAAGGRLYATADDLAAKRRTARETTDDAFGRLCHAFDTLQAMIRHTSDPWRSGPYAQRAQRLLRTHDRDLHVLIAAYHTLARRVGSQPERLVITHGEPHAGNVVATADGLVLVDWHTTLAAPPQRDLWDLAGDDAALLDYYAAATGIEIHDEALSLYRLWFDLAEVGGYLSLFHAPHQDTADTRQSWQELQHFLRPAERWPSLVG